MKSQAYSTKYPSLSITYVLIFCTGLACMAVAGYFLIEGLSEFSGNATTTNMLIIGGILFQITESICFIAASALTYHSLRWRYILFTLGLVLFGFSIGVMTLAQKTALQTGEFEANAIDEKRKHLRNQISSLQKVVDSYRLNAEKQSKSIYKDSRAKGQDSLNRATRLEQKKMQLADDLFRINTQRKQTSSDFFKRVEEVTGASAASTEFYFLVTRSLLIELSAIILMSFGANLRAYNKLVVDSGVQSYVKEKKPGLKAMFTRFNSGNKKENLARKDLKPVRTEQVNNSDEEMEIENSSHRDLNKPKVSGEQLNYLVSLVADLYEQQLISEPSAYVIKEGLSQYCSQKVSKETAGILSKLLSKRLDDPC